MTAFMSALLSKRNFLTPPYPLSPALLGFLAVLVVDVLSGNDSMLVSSFQISFIVVVGNEVYVNAFHSRKYYLFTGISDDINTPADKISVVIFLTRVLNVLFL
jgi:hypothetical protein